MTNPGPFIPGPGRLSASIIHNPDLSQYLQRTDVVTTLRPPEAESHGHTLSTEKTAKIENSHKIQRYLTLPSEFSLPRS